MKKITAIFILLMSFLVASPAMAQGEIQLNDETVLKWETGNLDPDTFNGDARGVSLVDEGEVIATADRVVIEAEQNNDDIAVGKMLITKLRIVSGDTVGTLESLESDGIPINIGGDSLSLSANSPADIAGSTILKGLDIRHEGTRITADEISSSSDIDLDLTELPAERTTLVELATIRNLIIDPAGNLTGGLFAALATDGKIVIDASAILFGQKPGESSNLGLTVDVRAKNMVQGSFTFEVAVNDESLKTIEELSLRPEEDITEEDTNVLLTLFLTQVNLKEAVLMLEDQGVLAPLKKYAFEQHGEDLADSVLSILAATIHNTAPATLEKISGPLRGFLERGGTLTISLKPDSPQPLGTFLAIQQAPDAILQVLGFDAEHSN